MMAASFLKLPYFLKLILLAGMTCLYLIFIQFVFLDSFHATQPTSPSIYEGRTPSIPVSYSYPGFSYSPFISAPNYYSTSYSLTEIQAQNGKKEGTFSQKPWTR